MTMFYSRVRVRTLTTLCFFTCVSLTGVQFICTAKQLGLAKCVLADLCVYATTRRRKVCAHCLLPHCGDFYYRSILYRSCILEQAWHSVYTTGTLQWGGKWSLNFQKKSQSLEKLAYLKTTVEPDLRLLNIQRTSEVIQQTLTNTKHF